MSLRKADTISTPRAAPVSPQRPIDIPRLLKKADQDDREFGEIQPSTLEKFFQNLRSMNSFESYSKETVTNIVKLVNHYLDTVLREGVFEFESPVLHFIKMFKNISLNAIPASFFSMVNTVAIILMVVSKKDLQKIRFFVNFWMEKIEIDVMDETDYDYPKYLLRSSLCNILVELGEYNDCLKYCNFNIKEINADIKTKQLPGATFETEKVRILILSILYKVDCLIFLEQSSEFLCAELISKCRSLMAKHNLEDDAKLKDVLERKSRLVESIEDKKSKSSVATNKSANLSHRGETNRQFIVKTQSKTKTSKLFNSQNFHSTARRQWNGTESSELTPRQHFPGVDIGKKVTKERSPKNVFFATKPKPRSEFENNQFSAMAERVTNSRGMTDRAMEKPKGILRKNTGHENDRKMPELETTRSVGLKKNFNTEIDRLLQISDFIQKEIKGLEGDAIEKFRVPPEDGDDLDKAIYDKYTALLKSKQELDSLKQNLDERIARFEKIEKTIDKNTAADDSASMALGSPKAVFSKSRPIPDKPLNRSERSIPEQAPKASFRLQKQVSNPPVMGMRLAQIPTGGKELSHYPSSNSTLSGRVPRLHQDYISLSQTVLSSVLSGFTSPTANLSGSNLHMKIFALGQIYEIQYLLSPRKGAEAASLTIRLFPDGAGRKGEIIAEEVLGEEALGYIFGRLSPLEVVSCHLPVSSFRDLGQFVQHVLHKYVSVEMEEGQPKISINDSPVSLLQQDHMHKFLGKDHELSLIHLFENNFRLLLRPIVGTNDLANPEAVMVDIVLSDMVKGQVFEQSAQDPVSAELLQRVKAGNGSMKLFETILTDSIFNRGSLWMKPGAEILTKAKQFLSVLATQAEDYLKFKGYNSEKLSQTLTFYLAAKLVDWKQMRFTWYGVFTNKQDENGFMMYGRNSFETFSNCKIYF